MTQREDPSFAFDQDAYITGHEAQEERDRYHRAIAPPIFMTSLHTADSLQNYFHTPPGAYIYGRYGNPTVELCEKKIAALEHGKRAFLYASGMSAATTAVLAVCRPGDHIISVHNAYNGLQDFLTKWAGPRLGMEVTFVRGDHPEEIEQARRENTKLIILESPGSCTFSVVDLERVVAFARAKGIVTYMDNSCCSPIFQKPLDLGIDMVMHSCTKYLGGHSDLLGGVLVTNQGTIISELASLRIWLGNIIGPMEAWLMIRGLRTLGVRMRAHEQTAKVIAQALEQDPRVARVYYPGLDSHPQRDLVRRQQTGSSGLLSFELNTSVTKAEQFVNRLRLFAIGPSWGGYESLAVMPLYGYSDEYAAWYGASRGLIRIHCGLEGADALLADINRALDEVFQNQEEKEEGT